MHGSGVFCGVSDVVVLAEVVVEEVVSTGLVEVKVVVGSGVMDEGLVVVGASVVVDEEVFGSSTSAHVTPSPEYPLLQVQSNPPAVLLHTAFASQGPDAALHSSTSLHSTPLPEYPELHTQAVAELLPAGEVAFGEHGSTMLPSGQKLLAGHRAQLLSL